MVKEIRCKNGEITLCDDEDYPLLSRFIWYMGSELKNGGGYPCCFLYGKNNTRQQVFMHQLVFAGTSSPDHIDTNKLNNQKHNLRAATHQLNGWNKGKPKRSAGRPCTSRYKGVRYAPLRRQSRWLAYFKHVEEGADKSTGKMIWVGYFDTEVEAARAYNKAIVEYRGKWAWINPIPDDDGIVEYQRVSGQR